MSRHRWPKEGIAFPNKTERECQNGCGIVKVTRHELEGGAGTPACEPVAENAAT